MLSAVAGGTRSTAARRRARSVVLVTHDDRVARAADRILRVRDGRIDGPR